MAKSVFIGHPDIPEQVFDGSAEDDYNIGYRHAWYAIAGGEKGRNRFELNDIYSSNYANGWEDGQRDAKRERRKVTGQKAFFGGAKSGVNVMGVYGRSR